MAVYFKFKSAKDYHSIPVDGPFISIINLKQRIFNSKLLGRGKDYDLIITNAHTNEDYLDEAMLIPKNISVLIRRVPGPPCKPIVTQPDKPKVENQAEDDHRNSKPKDCSGFLDIEASEWDDVFGSSLYTTSVQDSAPSNKTDEDEKIKALVENSGLRPLNHHTEGFGRGKRRVHGGRGFGQGGWDSKTPPQGYICHRCNVAGHFIQYCPTNGDPDYDIKKPLFGIPKPNEAAFEKEMEGLPSTLCRGDLPPELHCPLCKEVMKDAVLTSKCCFGSFCDKCIRDNIISKSMCVCGEKEILADDLIPNVTLRETINRILESGSSSAGNSNSGSGLRHKDASSAHSHQPRIPSLTHSASSKGAQMVPAGAEETPNLKDIVDEGRHSDALKQPVQSLSKVKISEVSDVSQGAVESVIVKKVDNVQPVQEGQQKMAVVEAGKKKRKKMSNPANVAGMEWMGMQRYMGGYMDPTTFNSCWPGMQHVVNEFWSPFGGSMPYNMGYGLGSSSNSIPSDPFAAQGIMSAAMVTPSQRNVAGEFGANMNVRSPFLDREDFKDRKVEVRRKQEMERRVARDLPQNHDYGREGSSDGKVSSMRSEHKSLPARSSFSEEHYNHIHNRDHSYKNSYKRNSHRDQDHDNDYKRSSLDHRFSNHHNSDSHNFTNRSSDESKVACPGIKMKYQHHQMDNDRDRDHIEYKSSVSKLHSSSEVSSDKNHRKRQLVRISLEDRCTEARQECVA